MLVMSSTYVPRQAGEVPTTAPGRERRMKRFMPLAATYNVVWGIAAIAAPNQLARFLGFDGAGDGMGWRATGVMVLAYAPAYLWAANHPRDAKPILATAVFGKALGLVGWLVGAATGRFGPRTVVLTAFNDAIWIPGLLGALRGPQPAGGRA
jgi:hypothetical protein